MSIQTTSRVILTAVGTDADFRIAVDAFAGHQVNAELALARMVAFAFVQFHKGGDDKHWAIDHIRATVRIAKGPAALLDKCLTRITKSDVPEGSMAKAALQFGNDFVSDFYRIDTKRREQLAAKRVESLKKKKADADKALKDAKAEGKAEAHDDTEELSFVLVGDVGQAEPLTAEEYMELRTYLGNLRRETQARKEIAEKTELRLASEEAA